MLPNPFICNILCDDISGNQRGPELIFRQMPNQHLKAGNTDGLGVMHTWDRAEFASRSQSAPSSEQICYHHVQAENLQKPGKKLFDNNKK